MLPSIDVTFIIVTVKWKSTKSITFRHLVEFYVYTQCWWVKPPDSFTQFYPG